MVVVGIGVIFAPGRLIAALFELQGFGDRDGDPSVLYLLALAVGFAACVAVPTLAWRASLSHLAPGWALAARRSPPSSCSSSESASAARPHRRLLGRPLD